MFFNVLFILMLFMSIFMAMTSSNWLILWMSLEVNMFFFIPLIMKIKENMDASLKYFLVQVLGSLLFFLGILLMWGNIYFLKIFILTLALFLKMGQAPFHFWFLDVCLEFSWETLILFLTIQKMLPFIMFYYIMNMSKELNLIFYFLFIGILIGSLGGINQLNLKLILGMSSLNNLSWLLMSISLNLYLWSFYYMVYVISLGVIIYLILNFKLFKIYSNIDMMNVSMSSLIFFLLITLGGLPPFWGFLAKLFVIQEMILNFFLLALMMVLMAILVIFYYLTLFVIFFVKHMMTKETYEMFYFSKIYVSLFIIFTPILLMMI